MGNGAKLWKASGRQEVDWRANHCGGRASEWAGGKGTERQKRRSAVENFPLGASMFHVERLCLGVVEVQFRCVDFSSSVFHVEQARRRIRRRQPLSARRSGEVLFKHCRKTEQSETNVANYH